jgi:SAM-dependent methyltransferase
MTQSKCPICGQQNLQQVVTINAIPVLCNVLHCDAEQARQAPIAHMDLVNCQHCLHLFNSAFNIDKVAYAPGYDATLFFSPTYQNYARQTADALIHRHHLRDKTILEIGCGDGRYLKMICNRGKNRGFGLDPGCEFDEASCDSQVHFSSDFFNRSCAAYQPDFILCRHVLEHLERPQSLIDDAHFILNRTCGRLYFEVPNANYTLQDLGIWDLIYEHFSYFTPHSLYYLFSQAGFHITRLESVYRNQFLCLEAQTQVTYDQNDPPEPQQLCLLSRTQQQQLFGNFAHAFRQKCGEWRRWLAKFHQAGERVVLWGTGSKGVSFLNIVDTDRSIDYVIDINPGKAGKFVAGTGHQVLPPDEVTRRIPAHVLVMNPIYYQEIEAELKERHIHAQLHQV